MDPKTLRQQLDEAEGHVARSAQYVAEQWNLIAGLERRGQDTAAAQALLALT
jgi:hypothetical protein